MPERTNALSLYERQLRCWAEALPKDARPDFGSAIDRLMMAVDKEIDGVSAAASEWSRNSQHVYAAKDSGKLADE